MHFRDWSWKDEILIERISNYKKNSATLERARARTSQKRTRAADF